MRILSGCLSVLIRNARPKSWLISSGVTEEELLQCAQAAYAPEKFSGDSPALLTLQQNGELNMYLLELWHGPTCAFKDMALQMLPHLLTRSLQKTGTDKTA